VKFTKCEDLQNIFPFIHLSESSFGKDINFSDTEYWWIEEHVTHHTKTNTDVDVKVSIPYSSYREALEGHMHYIKGEPQFSLRISSDKAWDYSVLNHFEGQFIVGDHKELACPEPV
jgi:hypothetical protein